jgi:putative ABC transport system permease protein
MVVTGLITRVVLPGQEVRRDGEYAVSRRFVTPQFFRAIGIPLLRGRDLEASDTADSARVAVVSESFTRRYWPGLDPLGRTFLYVNQPVTVVGVAGDIKVRGLERISEPQMYLPSSIAPDSPLTAFDPQDLVIRASGSETSLLSSVREVVRRVDPEQPVSHVMTGAELLTSQTAARQAQVQVLVALAAVALLLAGLGIYGLLAYTVAQRRNEIGLRLALGAAPGRIARRIVWDAVVLVGIGLIPGLAIAIVTGRAMTALLFGIQPSDPGTLAATVGMCLLVSFVGALVPALRALRVSPMTVMRSE